MHDNNIAKVVSDQSCDTKSVELSDSDRSMVNFLYFTNFEDYLYCNCLNKIENSDCKYYNTSIAISRCRVAGNESN